jgi:hypothetical protein
MTSQEMSREFNIVFESVASMNAPGYTEYEKSVLLTQAQEDIAIEVAQKGMDSNDYARTVLEKLLTNYSSLVVAANTSLFPSNAYRVTLPATFFYPFIEFAITTGTNTNRAVKPIDYNSYYTNISNPYANPYKDLYWRVYENGYLTIITDGTALTNIKGLYVAKPSPIITAILVGNTIDGLTAITQPVLNPIVHREIVYRAAMKAYAAMKDQAGYQLQNAEQSDN